MKGLVFDIKHYAIHDGPGIRTTIFLKGCPMACLWCHNPESQNSEPEEMLRERKFDGQHYQEKETVGKYMSTQEVMKEINKDKIFYQESDGGVTFSGGEPLAQADFLLEMLKQCKKEGYHTTLDTSGHSNGHVLKDIIGLTDLFLYDIKLMDEATHLKYTGVSNQLSLKNLNLIIDAGKEVIIRFPVIPGITDLEDNISEIAELMKARSINRIDLLSYHGMARNKYEQLSRKYELGHLNQVTDESLSDIKQFFESSGYSVGIGG
ncbi:MAG: glycyl-radical enzyme activating protein [Bacteroidota bacterium]|nr:glycyl-radical enzyme activating protein [Bacteroidota bacterium]